VEGNACGGGFERAVSIVLIFATNAALTNQINAVGKPRSHFGPADSWVIKISGTAVSAVGC
jgi:hypothetical protein